MKWKMIGLWIVLTFFVASMALSGEWYEGGNLHQATVKEWLKADYSNRLATSADWFISITKSHNPSLQSKLKQIPTEKYLKTIKAFSEQLEKCVSETAVTGKINEKIVEYASICYTAMYIKKQ